MAKPDILVVGGGVIGLSIAYELARHNCHVAVLDSGAMGGESSWAGAGMLPPGNPERAQTAEAILRGHSHQMWPEWSRSIVEEGGQSNGFHECGSLQVAASRDLSPGVPLEVSAWQSEGVPLEFPSRDAVRELAPVLNPDAVVSYYLPTFQQVRNPRHLKSLVAALFRRGVTMRSGVQVRGWETSGGRVTAAVTSDGPISAGVFVLAAGAWSSGLLGPMGAGPGVRPVMGQLVLLQTSVRPFRPVIESGLRYIVPRDDGRILIGATEEHTGFEKPTPAGGVRDLLDFAIRLVPPLGEASFKQTWSGLRPYAPRPVPIIGFAPNHANLFVAAGHYRSGLQLSPLTAVLCRQLILKQSPVVNPSLTAFDARS